MDIMKEFNADEIKMLDEAITFTDASMIYPEWSKEQQKKLNAALLKLNLFFSLSLDEEKPETVE